MDAVRDACEAASLVNAVAFDTLKFARSLRDKAHLTPDQAEAISNALAEVFAGSIPTKSNIDDVRSDIEALHVATKTEFETLKLSSRADLEAVRLCTKADIDALSLSTKADIQALRLSTKADLDTVRLSTKVDLDGLRLSTKADLEATKSDIIKWMFGTIGFQTVVVLSAVVALARSLH